MPGKQLVIQAATGLGDPMMRKVLLLLGFVMLAAAVVRVREHAELERRGSDVDSESLVRHGFGFGVQAGRGWVARRLEVVQSRAVGQREPVDRATVLS